VIDRGYLRDFAQAYEKGGFDRALIGYYSDAPDGLLVGGYVAEQTERLGLLIAHRPGLDHHSLQRRLLRVSCSPSWKPPLAPIVVSMGSVAVAPEPS